MIYATLLLSFCMNAYLFNSVFAYCETLNMEWGDNDMLFMCSYLTNCYVCEQIADEFVSKHIMIVKSI